MPDKIIYPLERVSVGVKPEYNPSTWDTPHRFAVECETDPAGHPEEVRRNCLKCRGLGLPVMFMVDSIEKQAKVKSILEEIPGVEVVESILTDYALGNASVHIVSSESTETASQVVAGVSEPRPELESAPSPAVQHEVSTRDGREKEKPSKEKPTAPERTEGKPPKPLKVKAPKDRGKEVAELKRAGARFSVKKISGREYVYAQFWVDGKRKFKSIGLLDEEIKRVLKNENIRL